MLTSMICKRVDFEAEWFRPWRPRFATTHANGIALGGDFLHRKEWEFVAVAQALAERGMLAQGKQGLGFAVGLEPLPALFASLGCKVTATDYPNDNGGRWRGLWATSKASLAYPEICDPDVFEKAVFFTRVDMREIPSHLVDFDFSWSCCALEHLGTLEAGVEFLRAQCACLRPGGVAVHTLEYNVSSNDETVTAGPTVVYRRRDIERLVEELRAEGMDVEDVNFTFGTSREDSFMPVRPFEHLGRNLAHLRVAVNKVTATSMLLIMKKRA